MLILFIDGNGADRAYFARDWRVAPLTIWS